MLSQQTTLDLIFIGSSAAVAMVVSSEQLRAYDRYETC